MQVIAATLEDDDLEDDDLENLEEVEKEEEMPQVRRSSGGGPGA